MDTKKLDKWADLLLDTGKRNNLINFKDTRASTVEVLLPSSDVLFEKVDGTASFEVFDPKIVEEDDDDTEESYAPEQLQIEVSEKTDASGSKAAFLAQYSGKIKRQNQILLYNAATNPLTAVKNIDKKAREFIEETGVNVAYMAFGFVHWKERCDRFTFSSHGYDLPLFFKKEVCCKFMEWYHFLIIAVGILVGLGVGFGLGIGYRKKVAEREIGSAEAEATRLINEAIRSGENRKKEMLLEAKDEIHKSRTEHDKEVKERRAELSKQERRLEQKEATLDKKTEAFERKEEELAKRLQKVSETQAQADQLKQQQLTELEKISGLTQDQAKEFLLHSIEDEVRHEAAMKIKEIEAQLKDEAEEKGREIIATAIQRCAADHAAETTVSVVTLPNDEMKGRIIGREGRNIRTLETITGVDLIIDDTPETITVSSFDPVRREIARLALEKLIVDGRIHPTRIEDMVEKARKEVDRTIREEGERACYETGVHNLNPELVKILGRQKYRTSYGQNVLNHSIEVAHIAGLMAAELGVDVAMAKRAGLLHDLGKSIDHEVEGSHVQLGADLARKYKENPVIVNAIEAHHGDVEPKTVIAVLVQAADAISAARPGARRENVENYIRRLQKLEELTGSYPGVEKAYAIQAGREVRIMVKPEVVTEDNMILLARDVAKKIESELEYPGQIKVNVIRETKAVEYAK